MGPVAAGIPGACVRKTPLGNHDSRFWTRPRLRERGHSCPLPLTHHSPHGACPSEKGAWPFGPHRHHAQSTRHHLPSTSKPPLSTLHFQSPVLPLPEGTRNHSWWCRPVIGPKTTGSAMQCGVASRRARWRPRQKRGLHLDDGLGAGSFSELSAAVENVAGSTSSPSITARSASRICRPLSEVNAKETLNKVAQAPCLSRLTGFQPVDSGPRHLFSVSLMGKRPGYITRETLIYCSLGFQPESSNGLPACGN